MDLAFGDEKTKTFITNVGLVTTNGPYGYNIMACEWTHHISYSPGLVAICLQSECATLANIRESKEFGISIAAKEQSILSSVVGNNSAKTVDKIKVAKALGFTFTKAKKIDVYMVSQSALHIECKVFKEIGLGDHVMVVGEVIAAEKEGSEPLALHAGRYCSVTFDLKKADDKKRKEIEEVIQRFRK